MTEDSLARQMSEIHRNGEEKLVNAGPFVAISREFGCGGFSLGLLLLDLINDDAKPGESWQIYHKEILDSLAQETDMAPEILERRRRQKPGLLGNFFQSFSGKKSVPSGLEIRNRMTAIIRELAIEGRCLLVGQGSVGATVDVPNGLSVRLEAPEEFRLKQIAFREALSETQAKIRVAEEMEKREYLQKIYERRFPRKPAFHLTFDCSVFSLAQIATMVYRAMKIKKLI
ncbi:MAG: cytidylate kinase family protein [Phycisphaerae bacterium]|nr:cytidylate kinase family protein [Phycisphaerae bacterium]